MFLNATLFKDTDCNISASTWEVRSEGKETEGEWKREEEGGRERGSEGGEG